MAFLPKGYSKLPTKDRYKIIQDQVDATGMKNTFTEFAKIARYRTNTSAGTTYNHDLNLLMASLKPEDCPEDYMFSVLSNKCIKDNKKNRETQAAIKANLSKLPVLFNTNRKTKRTKSKTPAIKKSKVTTAPSPVTSNLTSLKSVMLADVYDARFERTNFPVYVSDKIDGHRAIRIGDRLLSRGLKDIPNIHIRHCLINILPSGFDLELCVNNNLRETSTIVRHKTRVVNQLDVYVLDWVTDSDIKNKVPFKERYERLLSWQRANKVIFSNSHKACQNIKIHVVTQLLVKDKTTLEKAYDKAVFKGEEGVMIRDPLGLYVQARSKALLKWKRWVDTEGKIIDVVIEPGERRVKALLIEWHGVTFKLSSGLNSQLGKEFYKQKATLYGQLAKFKYQDVSREGMVKKNDAPRHAVFLDLRDAHDL